MKIKTIKSEIKAGHRVLAMYDKLSSAYPAHLRIEEEMEIEDELDRLENLLIKKTQKKAVKWAEKAGELMTKSNFDV